MTKILERPSPPSRPAEPERLVIDRNYIRGQAQEAIRLFLAPVSGVWTALVGRPEPVKPPVSRVSRRKFPRLKVARSPARIRARRDRHGS